MDTINQGKGRVQRYFYVVDVETFASPLVIIPNIGGPKDQYFWMKPRKEWREDFIEWLEAPHTVDRDQMKEEELAQKEDESSEKEDGGGSNEDEEEDEEDDDE